MEMLEAKLESAKYEAAHPRRKPFGIPTMVSEYWANSKKPRPIFVLRAGPYSIQPRGYSLGWSVSRAQVARWSTGRGDGPHYVQRIEPGDTSALWVPDLEETVCMLDKGGL